jgi:hypothetical protein
MTDVYTHSIERLGLLSSEQVKLVMRAYLLIRAVPERLRLLPVEQGAESLPDNSFIWVASKNAGIARQLHENFLEDIDKAISALSSGAG